VQVAKKTHTQVPIVFAAHEPLELGIVQSPVNPGGRTARRRFLRLALGTALAWSASGGAWSAGVRRIGVLADTPGPQWEVFRRTLAEQGYVEGSHVAFEWRWAQGQPARFPQLAMQLARSDLALIVTEGTPAARAAKSATSSIPIVMAIAGDPVALGLVKSLTRPGGNVTGSSSRSPELHPKQIDLLKQLLPGLSRLGVLANAANPVAKLHQQEIKSVAATLQMEVVVAEVRQASEIAGGIAALGAKRVDALIIIPDPSFDGAQVELAQHAAKARLAAVYNKSLFVDRGGLLAYGAHYADFFRRAALYAAKILKGANPAELPVEQASRYDLVINLRTAKEQGLVVPTELLLRADRVVE
jgi:putative tryptophan/tyrosine transport system substrate-binding protein